MTKHEMVLLILVAACMVWMAIAYDRVTTRMLICEDTLERMTNDGR